MLRGGRAAPGERFEFGKNWRHFLSRVDQGRILSAQRSLTEMLEAEDLKGSCFLDVGCGSGLFSLAARFLGARVHSFDYDRQSVACTVELKTRFFPGDASWTVERGSVLDMEYLSSLGTFDVVYSWGVLHHTGQMWSAMENLEQSVAANGRWFLALYNDAGSQSVRWRRIKRAYNRLPCVAQVPFVLMAIAPEESKSLLRSMLGLRLGEYIRSWTHYQGRRGMSRWHDIVDWVGGYPYEVTTPDKVVDFCRAKGLELLRLKCGGVGLGCNEFVFAKTRSVSAARPDQQLERTGNLAGTTRVTDGDI